MFTILTPNLARTPDLEQAPQESRPQAIQRPQPPSNWITGVRHYALLTTYEQIEQVNRNKRRLPAGSKKAYS